MLHALCMQTVRTIDKPFQFYICYVHCVQTVRMKNTIDKLLRFRIHCKRHVYDNEQKPYCLQHVDYTWHIKMANNVGREVDEVREEKLSRRRERD